METTFKYRFHLCFAHKLLMSKRYIDIIKLLSKKVREQKYYLLFQKLEKHFAAITWSHPGFENELEVGWGWGAEPCPF